MSKSLEKAETNKIKHQRPIFRLSQTWKAILKQGTVTEMGAWEVKTRDLWEWSIVSWVSGKMQERLDDLLFGEGQSGSMNLHSV